MFVFRSGNAAPAADNKRIAILALLSVSIGIVAASH